MGKIHNYTAIVVIIFIATMIFLIIQPMDFLNQNIEQIHKENEGLIWIIGLILAALLLWRTYANGFYQSELKKCALINKEKSIQIVTQNSQIIGNQEEYIKEIRTLNQNINKNAEKDLITLEAIQKHSASIEALDIRIDKSEVKLDHLTKIDKRLSSIEKLIAIHDQDLTRIKLHSKKF
jgi:hypothetical protein